jgi:hypothetical protein
MSSLRRQGAELHKIYIFQMTFFPHKANTAPYIDYKLCLLAYPQINLETLNLG